MKEENKTIKTVGRPTKYDPIKHIEDTRKLSTLGINEEDIAWYFGVHPNTFANWKKEHDELLWALKEGQSHKKISLMKAMYANATEKYNASVQIFLAKNWLGMSDKQEYEHSGELALNIKRVITNKTDGE